MEHSPVTVTHDLEEEMDTHPIQDENQHMRMLLLRLERRLMELSQEMSIQENLNQLLRRQEQELEESLEERDSRLTEALETINSLQSERENLQQQLQAMQEETEIENRKHQNERQTCPQSPQPCTANSDAEEKAHCSWESSSTATGSDIERPPRPVQLSMALLSVRLVDCRAKLGPDGCVHVAQ
ncbi:hypothetical protein AALO_G00100400 [Alosa alosa]|uniref:Uncharacterized protein n=1 Tax=Alosa alosa TaxID=278164 RepID=A0AAV6GXV6_9TELE|nr:tropomyosin-1-like [Alosa alosa]KAG5278570.1 hypothetical protein AALO_G00100400 [Alosa alosa]